MCDSANTRCIHCGSENIEKDYDYDYGIVRYVCIDCDEEFTDDDIVICENCGNQIVEGERRIDHDGYTFCSNECVIDFELKNEF